MQANKNPALLRGSFQVRVISRVATRIVYLEAFKATEEEVAFYLSILIAIRTMYCILTY